MQENYRLGESRYMKEVESRVPSKRQARFGGKHTHAPKWCDGAYPTLVAALRRSAEVREKPEEFLPWNYKGEEEGAKVAPLAA